MNFFGARSKLPGVDDLANGLQAIQVDYNEQNRFNQYLPNMSPTKLSFLDRNKENSPLPSPTKSIQYGVPTKATPVASSPTRSLGKDFYQKANSQKTKRLINVCQMYFLDYYCDMFDYVISRRQRLNQLKENIVKVSDPNEQQAIYDSHLVREKTLLRQRRLKPKHKDFQMITQVGQGGYGQVYLARKKDTKEIVALKILSKRLLMKLDETRHVLTERDILTNTRSEWLVKLFYAFQDSASVFLAMEFVPGGDYRTLLNNTGVLIPPHARFYISEMFMSVNALHQLGYTHRDLKPENFLIDAKGHIKLTDFGLAAGSVSTERIESMKSRLAAVKDLDYSIPTGSVKERQKMYRSLRAKDIHLANSIVGSPDYMALEVLEGRSYDYTIDYWSLGCMLFETLVGYPPFAGASPEDTYTNLRRWKEALRRPRYEDGRYVFSDRTWHLITKLIAAPKDRIRTFKQVMSTPYFAEIDWDNLRSRIPPFTPQLDDEEDAGYFDDFNNDEDMAKYKEVMAKRAAIEKMGDKNIDNRYFIGFTFKHSGSKFAANSKSDPFENTNGEEGDPFTTWY